MGVCAAAGKHADKAKAKKHKDFFMSPPQDDFQNFLANQARRAGGDGVPAYFCSVKVVAQRA
jgi:hypothetical protein